MLQQQIRQDYFPGDEPAKQAVVELANPVARYAEMTRRLANGIADETYRTKLAREARELRGLIVARARSGGIVDHEMPTFWEAAQLEASKKYRRKVEIYELAATSPGASRPQAIDPVERDLELQIIELEDRWKRAGERLAAKRAKLAAHRAGKVAA